MIRFRRDSDDLEDVLARVLDEESDPEEMPSSEEIELHLELEIRAKNRDKCYENITVRSTWSGNNNNNNKNIFI